MSRFITRETVDADIDAGNIEIAISNGNWWAIRRNGKTRRWKRDNARIHIPFKSGFKLYGSITETDFIMVEGQEVLNPAFHRLKEGRQ